MPRVKYYNTDTNKWEYADKSYGSNKNVDLAGYVKSVNGETPDENGNIEVQIGATEEEVAQIAKNKQDIEKLFDEKLDAYKLSEAVDEALAQAKASGEFKGDAGEPGKDYILTDADKQEIAELAAQMVEVSDTYDKNEIDAIMGSYITDIDTLIGGDS